MQEILPDSSLVLSSMPEILPDSSPVPSSMSEILPDALPRPSTLLKPTLTTSLNPNAVPFPEPNNSVHTAIMLEDYEPQSTYVRLYDKCDSINPIPNGKTRV